MNDEAEAYRTDDAYRAGHAACVGMKATTNVRLAAFVALSWTWPPYYVLGYLDAHETLAYLELHANRRRIGAEPAVNRCEGFN